MMEPSCWPRWMVAVMATGLLACGVSASEHQATLDELARVRSTMAARQRDAEQARAAVERRTRVLEGETVGLRRSLEACTKAAQAKSVEPPPGEIEVTVGATDYNVGGDRVTASGLLEALKHARQARPEAALRIQSGPAATYRAVMRVVDLGKQAGFTRINFKEKESGR